MHFGRYGNQISLARWKSCYWREWKRLHTGREKWNTTTLCRAEIHQRSAEGNKNISYTWEDHVLNIHFCVKFVIPIIFTQIWKKGIRLFNNSNDVCKPNVTAVYLRFHGTLKSAATSQLCLCYFHQFHNWFCSKYTALRWPSRGKFVILGLTDISFVLGLTDISIVVVVVSV